MSSYKIKFIPQNVEVDVESGKNVMETAWKHGLPVESSCKGNAQCGECRVFLKDGHGNVLPPTQTEIELIGQGHFIDQRRLSCQLYCFGNVTVDLSEQVEKQKNNSISKSFLKRIKKNSDSKINSIGDSFIEDSLNSNKKTRD